MESDVSVTAHGRLAGVTVKFEETKSAGSSDSYMDERLSTVEQEYTHKTYSPLPNSKIYSQNVTSTAC